MLSYCRLFVLWRHWSFLFRLPFLKLFDLSRRQPMLRTALQMSTSIPRGGRGAGRAVRRNNSRPYHASTTRNSLAAAAAVKPAEPRPAAAPIPTIDDRLRHFSD